MKRACLITYQAFTRGTGGGTGYASTLAHWAVQAGYHVTLLTRSPDAKTHHSTVDGIDIVELGGWHIRHVPSARLLDKDIVFGAQVHRYLRRFGNDFALVHCIIPDITGCIPRKLRARTIVSVIEDFWTPKVLPLQNMFCAYQRFQAGIAARDAAAITLPSTTAQHFFERRFSAHAKKYRVVYDFIDADIFRPSPATAHASDIRIFVPQRAVSQKMVGTAIQALHRIHAAFPSAYMVIAGGGPLEPALRKQAAALELAQHISFLGSIPHKDMAAQYQQASLVVITSASEGGQPSPTAAEAMATGTPVIMTDVCDTDKAFKGIVLQYHPGDAVTLAAHMQTVLQDTAQAKENAKKAQEIILSRFSLPVFLSRFADVYRLF